MAMDPYVVPDVVASPEELMKLAEEASEGQRKVTYHEVEALLFSALRPFLKDPSVAPFVLLDDGQGGLERIVVDIAERPGHRFELNIHVKPEETWVNHLVQDKDDPSFWTN